MGGVRSAMRAVGLAAALTTVSALALLAPAEAEGQTRTGTRAGTEGPTFAGGWHVGAGWSQSVQQNPFGTQWGDATRGFNARLETPGIRGFRPVVEGARVDVVGACRSRDLCDALPGWTLRVGLLVGDDRGGETRGGTTPLLTPYLQAELGAFFADDEDGARFAPAGRLGLLLPTWYRMQPRLEMSRVRYPTTESVWEVGLGVRVRLR
jgi:hypothetical protein